MITLFETLVRLYSEKEYSIYAGNATAVIIAENNWNIAFVSQDTFTEKEIEDEFISRHNAFFAA